MEIKKKKDLGTLAFISIVFGIILVSAAITYVAYHHEFIKTIHVWSSSGGDEQVTISASGDIGTSTISCQNGVCSTGQITLTNQDTNAHTCTVSTTGSDLVTITYSGDTTDGIVSLAGGETKNFVIHYETTAIVPNDYAMTTSIDCP